MTNEFVEAMLGMRQMVEKGSMWLPQMGGGASVRLDRERRLSAGVSVRYFRDVREWSAPRAEWLNVMGTLSYAFGRR